MCTFSTVGIYIYLYIYIILYLYIYIYIIFHWNLASWEGFTFAETFQAEAAKPEARDTVWHLDAYTRIRSIWQRATALLVSVLTVECSI